MPAYGLGRVMNLINSHTPMGCTSFLLCEKEAGKNISIDFFFSTQQLWLRPAFRQWTRIATLQWHRIRDDHLLYSI